MILCNKVKKIVQETSRSFEETLKRAIWRDNYNSPEEIRHENACIRLAAKSAITGAAPYRRLDEDMMGTKDIVLAYRAHFQEILRSSEYRQGRILRPRFEPIPTSTGTAKKRIPIEGENVKCGLF